MQINRFGYYWLDTWVLANVIQLATQDFCARNLNHTNDPCGRQYDQMTQAARSVLLTVSLSIPRTLAMERLETPSLCMINSCLILLISFVFPVIVPRFGTAAKLARQHRIIPLSVRISNQSLCNEHILFLRLNPHYQVKLSSYRRNKSKRMLFQIE